MPLKGMVRFFTAALILFSLWRLSFTFIAHNVEKKIESQAQNQISTAHPELQGAEKDALLDQFTQRISDSLRGETVFNFLGIKYNYQEIKEKELQLGLDLQGGMAVTLEVELSELIRSMSNNPSDIILEKALEETERLRVSSSENYVSVFGQAYENVNPNGKLAYLFTKSSQPEITNNSTNAQVLDVIRNEAREAVRRTYNVLQQRIDKFGVASPNINLNESRGIINIELAGVKDPESVRNILQATAQLQFWEVATNLEMAQYLMNANTALENYLKAGQAEAAQEIETEDVAMEEDVAAVEESSEPGSLSDIIGSSDEMMEGALNQQPTGLFSIMSPMVDMGSGQFVDATIIGGVLKKDADQLLEYFEMDIVKNQFPSHIKFMVGEYPGVSAEDKNKPQTPYGVYAIKTIPGTNEARLEGDRVRSARFDFQQSGRAEIQLVMDQQGTSLWARLTKDNIGKPIAIALDNFIYSAPIVQGEITGGTSSITGNFTPKEGTELANILQTGKLPAPAKIVQEQIVGPTLGQESITGGMTAFVVALGAIFILMLIYYNTGGFVAIIALFLSMFFTFGILSNLGATLTMAGIAGIVLGIGMSVDTNVIIFERIKEELALGKSYAESIKDGYNRSYAPVLDAHITSIITAVILYTFGMGPIKGFATTQIIALILSLFTGIMVSRLITDSYMRKGKHFNYFTKISKSLFQKANFNFVGNRKKAYIVAVVILLLGVGSFVNGFFYGVEFDGGRSYTLKMDQAVSTTEVREKMQNHFEKYPIVKTVGLDNQINITTDYMIHNQSPETEGIVLETLFNGLQAENFIPADVDLATFSTQYIQSTQTVSPTISEDLKRGALIASALAIISIFLYILLRFRKWQYSAGTIAALVHDMAVVLILFSFFKTIVPFSLEIDQHFIAAFLTVIGLSINDTVIIFDRIREYFRKDPNGKPEETINKAINSTLSRTIMTSMTVFITAVILFIFGGEVLRGFAFAMAIGVLAASYSSIFVAAPILIDLDKKSGSLSVEEDKEARIAALKEQA